MDENIRRIGIVIGLTVFSLVILCLSDKKEERVVINEVCSQNIYSYADKTGDYYDWIEIYNAGDKDVALKGYRLSDKRENNGKENEIFNDTVIGAHDYLVVYLTNTVYGDESNGIYANFQISKKGETIYLFGPDNKIVDEVEVPILEKNITYARQTDGANLWQKKKPTPGYTNNNVEEYLKPGEINKIKPVFSADSGFYNEPFEVSIEYDSRGKIYYTLDGSVPDKNSIPYEGKIQIRDASSQPNVYSMRKDISALFLTEDEWSLPDELVDKATVVRAIAYDSNGYPSEIETATYFVGFEDKKEYKDISVVSLVTDPCNLFDYDYGIYVLGRTYDTSERNIEITDWEWKRANYRNGKKESEREVHLDFFGEDRELLFSQECGIRIKGGVSRAFLQKSFNLYARDEYDGADKFKYDFFGEDMEYSAVTLFAGGNDTVSRMKDFLANDIAKELNFASMRFRPCMVFLNGEYWGFYYLTEKYNAKYISGHYGVNENDVIIIKNWTVEEGTEEDLVEFLSDMEYIETSDMTIDENYKRASELMDIDSLIDYFGFQLYIARRGDWMNKGGGNFACWKLRSKADGKYGDSKWRWMLFDVNSGSMEASDWNMQAYVYEEDDFRMLANLLRNPDFKRRFQQRQNEMREQLFKPDKIIPIVKSIASQNRLPVLKTYDRFYNGIFTKDDYEKGIQEIMDFYQERYDYVAAMRWD